MRILIVDCANVVGARPDGWWKDRAAAASKLYDAVAAADLDDDEIVLVYEGAAKSGVPAVRSPGLRVVHAPKDGDSTIVAEARRGYEGGHRVRVVTADRALSANVAAYADTVSPTWLLHQVSPTP
ncbi:hypothetical protein Back2_24960 [Nocardioides baekrokdamisoli]|uniref:RNA-binding protein n=1 Tax=Nocardioides baekrokdamisoli TaxID=1804624 RepID=A0A3G9J5E0_9ACTN|nr:NYN domain-containing protein [Nocardioides baekrokdamisoli]BBH18209.1 hypothetical protein Back2_24960 [Nocardioides baekrokdamisoli]